MRLFLELGEHGLAEKGAAELLHKIVDKVFLPFGIGFGFQQIFHKQSLVAGRSYLGHEYLVSGIDERLCFPCKITMEGVPHLMGNGEHTVYRVVVVQKNVRVSAEGSPGIRSAALALVFVYVYPAAVKCAPCKFSHLAGE